MRRAVTIMGLGVAGVLLAGCATNGGDEVSNTIFATHSTVKKLEKDLGASVDKLNETTADLTARVSESDRQTRELKSLVEENQVKLDRLQGNLDRLTATLYRYLGLTPETGAVDGFSATGPQVRVGIPGESEGALEAAIEPITPTEEGSQLVSPSAPASAATSAAGPLAAYQEAQKSYINQDYALAQGQYQEYLQQYPNTDYYPYSLFWLGMCQFKLDQHEEAIKTFEALRREFPTSSKVPIALNNQGVAHMMLGQKERAKELFKELVDNYPMSPAAERARAQLQELGSDG